MKTDLLTLAKAEFYLVLYMLPFLLASWYVIYKWGRKTLIHDKANEQEYDRQYDDLQKDIEDYPVVTGNYEVLKARIETLKALPYKDPERTEVLENRLLIKFRVQINISCDNQPALDKLKKAEEKILALSN